AFTPATNSFTTSKLTSASSSARRTSRMAFETVSSSSRVLRPRPASAVCMRSASVSNTAANCRGEPGAARAGALLRAEDLAGGDARQRHRPDALDRVQVGRVEVVEREDRVVDRAGAAEPREGGQEHLAHEPVSRLPRLPDLADLDAVWCLGGEVDDLADRRRHGPVHL